MSSSDISDETLIELIKKNPAILEKLKQQKNIDSWNSEKEELVKRLGEESAGYSWMNSACEQHYKKLDKYIWIPATVLGAVFSIGGLTTIGIIPIGAVGIVLSAITYLGTGISTTLGTIHAQMEFSKRAQLHKYFFVEYSSIYKQATAELSKNRSDRENADKYIIRMLNNMNKLLFDMPSIPEKIVKKYNNVIKERFNLGKPIISGQIDTIKIRGAKNTVSRKTDLSKENVSSNETSSCNLEKMAEEIDCETIGAPKEGVHTSNLQKIFTQQNLSGAFSV